MTIQRVEKLSRAQVSQQLEAIQVQQRLTLFNASSFERVSSVRFGDGTHMAVPAMSKADQMTAAMLFGSVPPDRREQLEQLATTMGQAIYTETQSNYEGVQVGSFSAGFTDAVTSGMQNYVALTGRQQADTAVQGMLFTSMIGIEQDLGNFARMVQGKIDLAGEMRTDIAELQDAISNWPEGQQTMTFSWTEVTYDEDGKMIVTPKEQELTKEQAMDLRENLSGQLSTLRDFNEMDKYELQQMTHDYQQAMNTLTAMLKNMHDTMKAIIQNVKA